jgi:hypothetical protein
MRAQTILRFVSRFSCGQNETVDVSGQAEAQQLPLTFLPFNRANHALNSCPIFINLQEAPRRRREEPSRSNFGAFCKGYRVVNIDAKVADGILDV